MVSKIPLTVTPFRLPLTRKQFADALRKGHGRALMHVCRHGVGGVDDLLVDACARSLVYDSQCEDGRADWLVRMLEAVPAAKAELLARILARFEEPVEEDSADRYQRLELAARLAMLGDRRFHAYVHSVLESAQSMDALPDLDTLVELDGADGLRWTARRIGECLYREPDAYAPFYPIEVYDDKYGQGAGRRILREAAKGDPDIERYLGSIEEPVPGRAEVRRGERKRRMRAIPPEEIIEEIRRIDPQVNNRRGFYRDWGRWSTEEARLAIAAAMFEDDDGRAGFYLACLDRQGLPELDERIFRFSESECWHTRRSAHCVLARHRHPLVRQLALDRIRNGETQADEIAMLTLNCEPGDWGFICAHVALPADDYELHRIVRDLLDVYSVNENEDTRPVLEFVYEFSPCSSCREDAIEALARLATISDWIRAECASDAIDGIRELFASLDGPGGDSD